MTGCCRRTFSVPACTAAIPGSPRVSVVSRVQVLGVLVLVLGACSGNPTGVFPSSSTTTSPDAFERALKACMEERGHVLGESGDFLTVAGGLTLRSKRGQTFKNATAF